MIDPDFVPPPQEAFTTEELNAILRRQISEREQTITALLAEIERLKQDIQDINDLRNKRD